MAGAASAALSEKQMPSPTDPAFGKVKLCLGGAGVPNGAGSGVMNQSINGLNIIKQMSIHFTR